MRLSNENFIARRIKRRRCSSVAFCLGISIEILQLTKIVSRPPSLRCACTMGLQGHSVIDHTMVLIALKIAVAALCSAMPCHDEPKNKCWNGNWWIRSGISEIINQNSDVILELPLEWSSRWIWSGNISVICLFIPSLFAEGVFRIETIIKSVYPRIFQSFSSVLDENKKHGRRGALLTTEIERSRISRFMTIWMNGHDWRQRLICCCPAERVERSVVQAGGRRQEAVLAVMFCRVMDYTLPISNVI